MGESPAVSTSQGQVLLKPGVTGPPLNTPGKRLSNRNATANIYRSGEFKGGQRTPEDLAYDLNYSQGRRLL